MRYRALSIRLVPDQHASVIKNSLKQVIEQAFEKLGSSNKLVVDVGHSADPWLGNPQNEVFRTLEEAVTEAWALEPHTSLSTNGTATTQLANGPAKRGALQASSAIPAKSSRRICEDLPRAGLDGFSLQQQSARSGSPQRPLYIREGGSIPAIRFLEKEFNAPAAHLPCGQASDSAHLDNERIRISNLYKSREIFRKVFRNLT